MEEKITAKILDLIITTKCTMNCKLCAVVVPYIDKPIHTPKEIVFKELKKCFEVYDFAERVELLGGEPLMHPELTDIVREILKYKGRFDMIRFTTNSTIIPKDDLIDLINQNQDVKFDFILDDYGKYSVNLKQIQKLLDENHIAYRTDIYHGEDQRFDGWIHFGDFEYMNYSAHRLNEVYANCVCVSNAFRVINNGKVFPCVYSFSGSIIDKVPLVDGEYVDLFDDTLTIEEKREIARRIDKNPVEACKYCKGFDSQNAERYPAAEQLPRRKVDDIL